MKALVYGFRSHKNQKKNITEQILETIPEEKYIIKFSFPQRLNKKNYIRKIKEVNPDVIIGLGQHEVGDMYRVERKAINVKRKNAKTEPAYIFSNKPHHYFLSLMLEEDNDSWHCYNAGDGVSNYSMYVISHLFKNIPFAFINIPKNADASKAADYVKRKIIEAAKKHSPVGEQSALSNFIIRK